MADPSLLKNTAEGLLNAGKDELKQTGQAVAEQFGVDTTKDTVRGLYRPEKPLTQAQYQEKSAQDATATGEGISKIQQELAMQSSGNSEQRAQTTPTVKPVTKVQMEHHEEAENLGVVHEDEESQKKAQEQQIEAQEKTKKEEEEKQKLENPIEAPAGKITGVQAFKRNRPKARMQPPKSSERKAGLGVGG